MTDHLHALAMRTKAATDIGELGDDLTYIPALGQRLSARAYEISREILALPLEADHVALLAEAVKLPEIAAMVEYYRANRAVQVAGLMFATDEQFDRQRTANLNADEAISALDKL